MNHGFYKERQIMFGLHLDLLVTLQVLRVPCSQPTGVVWDLVSCSLDGRPQLQEAGLARLRLDPRLGWGITGTHTSSSRRL